MIWYGFSGLGKISWHNTGIFTAFLPLVSWFQFPVRPESFRPVWYLKVLRRCWLYFFIFNLENFIFFFKKKELNRKIYCLQYFFRNRNCSLFFLKHSFIASRTTAFWKWRIAKENIFLSLINSCIGETGGWN